MSIQRFFVVGFMLVLAALGAEGQMAVYVGEAVTPIERDAAIELSRLWFAASGSTLPIRQVASTPTNAEGFVVGTPESLPATAGAWPFDVDEPGHDGYVLAALRANHRLLAVGAPTPEGVQNGVYGLLEMLGFGFYPSGERIPEQTPDLAGLSGLPVSHTPAFSVRGVLPWHNYLNGPTAWELADYRAYIDQLARMRMNLVVFHAYDNEPFAAFEREDEMVYGAPLFNTSRAGWGGTPMATENFFAGTEAYFARDYFGAESSFIEDDAASIRATKDVLAEAMAYARNRGLNVGLGFEVTGDALDPHNQALFEERLRAILTDYPALDYLWIWQPEMLGLTPTQEPEPRSPWATRRDEWADVFADIPEPRRQAEFARIALYARHARTVIEAVRPEVGLVVSGWGGDEHFRFTDALPGLDGLLPEDVVFSALDNSTTTPHISDAYGQLHDDRPQWPILWFERDGDLWMPQPNLDGIAGACRDAYEKGASGLLGLHWRTRDIDHAAGFAARFAWNPELTVDAFLETRAEHLFGPESYPELAALLKDLEQQGYRWIGGEGHDEHGTFMWSEGDDAHVAELRRIVLELRNEMAGPGFLSRVTGLVPGPVGDMVSDVVTDMTDLAIPSALASRFLPGWTPSRKDLALVELLGEIDYVLAFDRAARSLAPGGSLDALIAGGQTDLAMQMIWDSGLADAFHAHARRMTTKGDLGTLALMNTKAWADLRERLGLPDATVAQLEAQPPGLSGESSVLVLSDRVIVTGLAPESIRVYVRARPLGSRQFTRQELERIGRGTYRLTFPEAALDAPHFEFGIEVRSGFRTSLVWPPGFPARTQTASGFSHDAPPALSEAVILEPLPPEPPDLRHRVRVERHSVTLTWAARLGETYKVYRNGTHLGTVADGWFEDMNPPSGQTVTYAVVARNVASGVEAEGRRTTSMPEFPLPEPPAVVDVATRANRAILGWLSDDPRAVAYRISRYDIDQQFEASFDVTAAPGNYIEVADPVEGAEAVSYTVAGVGPDGRVGPPSPAAGVIPSDEPIEPRVRLSFDSDEFLVGLAQLAEDGLALGGSGWAELAEQSDWDPDRELTLSIWVKLDDIEGMPVLICKGAWQEAGYFLQIFNGHVRFYLAGVDTLDAGAVTPGRWQHIAATYGRNQMRIYLDGELAGQKHVSGEPLLGEHAVYLGRYGSSDDEVYFVRGLMDDIQVYAFSLTPEEIRALYESTRRS